MSNIWREDIPNGERPEYSTESGEGYAGGHPQRVVCLYSNSQLSDGTSTCCTTHSLG